MSERLRNAQGQTWLWLSLLAVLIVASLFRLWQIDAIPPGLFGDEAVDGLDALDVLAGRGRVFFPANFGREGLHMWIVALSIKLLGVTPLAVRLPSVVAGILTGLATWWVGYEMFVHRAGLDSTQRRKDAETQRGKEIFAVSRRLIPLATALYVSTSFWHVHFSRFGIRGVFTTLATALTVAALWRALDTHHWRWFAISGLFMGLGAHFYTASRFVPLFLGIFFALWMLLSLLGVRQEERVNSFLHLLIGLALMYGVAALVFAPLGYYFLTHPGSFTQRASEVSAFQDDSPIAALAIMARAAWANLIQFVLPGAGDQARFYNLPGRAVFEPLTAVLALAGLVLSLKRWRDPAFSFLLLWFVLMATPAFLAVDRYPTLPRLLGLIPGVYFFPAIALSAAAAVIVRRLPSRPRLALVAAILIVVLALLVHAGATFRDYFRVWGPSLATADAFEADMVETWRWLGANPEAGEVFLSSDLYRHPTFMFLHEQVPTSEYFSHQNPTLHWFDARAAWPLPGDEDANTTLVGDSALPPAYIIGLLDLKLEPLDEGFAYRAFGSTQIDAPPLLPFTDHLSLLGQFTLAPPELDGQTVIVQVWRTTGPDVDGPQQYQIQSALVAASGEQLAQTSDAMRFLPAEWDEDGVFLTWQIMPSPDQDAVEGTALRVVPAGEPPLEPAGSEGGWLYLPLTDIGQILSP